MGTTKHSKEEKGEKRMERIGADEERNTTNLGGKVCINWGSFLYNMRVEKERTVACCEGETMGVRDGRRTGKR